MLQADIYKKMHVTFFETADPDTISLVIKEQIKSGELRYVVDMLDSILEANLKEPQLSIIIENLEEEYLLRNLSFLCKYLFLLYDKKGDNELSRYFLDMCIDKLRDNPDYERCIEKYAITENEELSANYFKNNYYSKYLYNGERKDYSVYSFSTEIGQNLTLLKTEYGSIIFDCGAKCFKNGTKIITVDEFKQFLIATETSVDQIKGVFVSHAHLDHYGSLTTIINSGIDKRKIFMGTKTKELISFASRDMISLHDSLPVSSFFVANSKIKIVSFENGHIVGSEGFIVSFDNINVVYTGDFCLHDQKTVKGLNTDEITNCPEIITNGIDCLITESTYGYLQHYLSHNCAEKVLKHFVERLLTFGYKIFLPSFAIGRSQELALMLNNNHSVLLDGLTIKISRKYEELTELCIYNENTRYSKETDDKIHNFDCNSIIIASSGMLSENSTSANYLKDFFHCGEKIAIIKTGFINAESYGNDLLDSWRSNDNLLLDIPLSAHASYEEIIELINALNPKNIVAIHGNGIAHKETNKNEKLVSNIPEHNKDELDLISLDTQKEMMESALSNNNFASTNIALEEKHEPKKVESIIYIHIIDEKIRSKMNNVYKMGDLVRNNKQNFQRTSSIVMACKLLIKFLKDKQEYSKLADFLNELDNYENFWEYIKDSCENDYTCKIVFKKRTDENEELELKKTKIVEDKTNSDIEEPQSDHSISPWINVSKNTDNPYLSDLMIVKMNENDYYVSEKIQGRDVYYKLLMSRSKKSDHYLDIETARYIAKEMRIQILSINPNCQIFEYDINDFSDEDEIFKYIDIKSYQAAISKKIDICNELTETKTQLDFYLLGQIKGYMLAFDCSMSKLKHQIKKAEALIVTFNDDSELFAFDKLVYNGFIFSLKESINLQKQYRWKEKNFTLHLIDMRDEPTFLTFKYEGEIPLIGTYNIIPYKKGEMIESYTNNPNVIYIILADKGYSLEAILEELKMPPEANYSFLTIKKSKSNINTDIARLVSNTFKLGSGDDELKIDDEWIKPNQQLEKLEEIDVTEIRVLKENLKLPENLDILVIADNDNPLLDTDISDMELSVRAFKCLERASVYTLRDLVGKTYKDLYKIRNLGKKKIIEIIQKIRLLGIAVNIPNTKEVSEDLNIKNCLCVQ